MKVSEVMTRKPHTLKASDSIRSALALFAEKKVSGCPVVSRGRLVGIITQSDILKLIDVHARIHREATPLVLAALFSEKYETLKPAFRALLRKPLRSCMQQPVVTIEQDDDVYEAAKLINKHGIDRLPVVSSGRLVGILSKSDMMRILSE